MAFGIASVQARAALSAELRRPLLCSGRSKHRRVSAFSRCCCLEGQYQAVSAGHAQVLMRTGAHSLLSASVAASVVVYRAPAASAGHAPPPRHSRFQQTTPQRSVLPVATAAPSPAAPSPARSKGCVPDSRQRHAYVQGRADRSGAGAGISSARAVRRVPCRPPFACPSTGHR